MKKFKKKENVLYMFVALKITYDCNQRYSLMIYDMQFVRCRF